MGLARVRRKMSATGKLEGLHTSALFNMSGKVHEIKARFVPLRIGCSLHVQVCLVTGGSRGIGLMIAQVSCKAECARHILHNALWEFRLTVVFFSSHRATWRTARRSTS